MLEDEDDPLSRSFFDVGNGAALSLFGNVSTTSAHPASASFFAAHYEEDPWSSVGRYDTTVDTASGPLTTPDIPTGSTGVTTTGHASAYEPFPAQTALETVSVANALSGVKLPEIYNTIFAQHQQSGRISVSSLYRIMEGCNLSAMDIEKIIRIIVPSGATYVTRPEFNAALGLLACAQNHMEISLDSLYQNRFYLPEPRVPTKESSHMRNYDPLKPKSPELSAQVPSEPTSPKMNGVDGHRQRGRPAAVAGAIDSSKVTETKPTKTLNTQNWFQKIEEIKVTIAPEREGFIFKHVNYIVESQKRSSIVLRRYSDFWWLMEVLSRRYPFRMLPNIPPKKVTGRDSAFLEKRRKGLSRFINAIVRHPTLRNDDVVVKFLTEPSELAGWRKQHPPSLEEEYRRKQRNIDEIQSMIPSNLDEQLRKAHHRVTAAIEQYINLCFIMERMIRRMRGQATDYVRYSISLNALAETEHRYHAGECQECQQVVKGYETVAKHMQKESTILENQVNVAADGVLENLKRFRDLLVSYRELDERREKLAGNQIESLSKRISSNRTKVNQHKGVPGMEAEVARLEEAIRTDEATRHDQQCRQVFIQFCMWSELIYLHKQQAFVSSLYRGYVRDMMQFSQRRSQNWQDLQSPVLEMPVEPELFS